MLGAGRAAGAENGKDAVALMRRVDEMWRGASSHALLTMTVKTRRYRRAMTMDSWSQGKEKSLVKILSPKKDRGITTLKVERNIWNYLPKINRITKIPSNMMMGSWMGSHFTNDDLVKESSFEDDYKSEISYKGMRDGKPVKLPPEALVAAKVRANAQTPRLLLPRKYSLRKLFFFINRLEIAARPNTANV